VGLLRCPHRGLGGRSRVRGRGYRPQSSKSGALGIRRRALSDRRTERGGTLDPLLHPQRRGAATKPGSRLGRRPVAALALVGCTLGTLRSHRRLDVGEDPPRHAGSNPGLGDGLGCADRARYPCTVLERRHPTRSRGPDLLDRDPLRPESTTSDLPLRGRIPGHRPFVPNLPKRGRSSWSGTVRPMPTPASPRTS
jgi:hypothetical protein